MELGTGQDSLRRDLLLAAVRGIQAGFDSDQSIASKAPSPEVVAETVAVSVKREVKQVLEALAYKQGARAAEGLTDIAEKLLGQGNEKHKQGSTTSEGTSASQPVSKPITIPQSKPSTPTSYFSHATSGGLTFGQAQSTGQPFGQSRLTNSWFGQQSTPVPSESGSAVAQDWNTHTSGLPPPSRPASVDGESAEDIKQHPSPKLSGQPMADPVTSAGFGNFGVSRLRFGAF